MNRKTSGAPAPNQTPEPRGTPASGPPRAWIAERFEELEAPLLAYVARKLRLGNKLDVARDIVQEAFVKLCQQPWPKIEPHAQAWLYRTCRNRAIDLTRREGRMSTMHSAADVSTLDNRHGPSPGVDARQAEQLAKVQNQLECLPERQQELLRLRLQDGLSYKQIATVTGLSPSNVGYLLHQAVTSLRKKLQA